MMTEMLKQMTDAKRLSVEMGGFGLSTDLETAMARHAGRIETAWRLTTKLVDQGVNEEGRYTDIANKFQEWTA
eukprot:9619323-Alexandrium_andersonii.AAC.1